MGSDYVFAGFISTRRKWRQFSSEWKECCASFGRKNYKTGRRRFHFKEMMQFSDDRKNIHRFFSIIERHALLAISCRIHLGEYNAARERVQIAGGNLSYGSLEKPYILTFRFLLEPLAASPLFRSALPGGQKIHFVFDEQINDKKIIQREWQQYWPTRPDEFRDTYVGVPDWENDDECLPLQAADLWAGAVRRAYKEGRSSELFRGMDPVLGQRRRDAWIFSIAPDEDFLVRAIIDMARKQTSAQIFDKLGRIGL